MADRVSFTGLDANAVRTNLERVHERIAAAGGDPDAIRICAAVKYVPAEELPVLAEAGIRIAGENRAQELAAKQAAHPDLFEWHFIGGLQSRKVKDIAPNVALIHSVSSDSVIAQLEKHPAPAVLIQVNVAGEETKEGVAPGDLGAFIESCPVPVLGLMTMPPLAERAEDSRRYFARLAELASEHGLSELSMGTTQDFEVAVGEGATIVRLGTVLYA
jgi:pyridoxal phosphate enzyme (YggS family)